MIGLCPLASGSKGNCIFLGTSRSKILIDVGISCKEIQKRLEEIKVDLAQIDAILITHEHGDHISGLKTVCEKYQIPIFCNAETAKGIYDQLEISQNFKIFATSESFEYKDLEIFPFSIQHDTLDPVAFRIHIGELKIAICTDLGMVTTLVQKNLQNLDYLIIEANHEPSMVHACSRPQVYKQRVLGRQGHLSNDECSALIASIYHKDLKEIYLAHLSAECNCQELALKIVKERLNQEIPIHIAHQDEISQCIRFN